MIDSCEIMFVEEVCCAWDRPQPIECQKQNTFTTSKNWWISLNKSGNDTQPVRKRSDFNQALSTLNRLHQRSWRTTTRAHAIAEVPGMETGIEFFLHLVAMERILVVFLRIQSKSTKRRQAKVCDRTEQPVVYRTLAKTSDK